MTQIDINKIRIDGGTQSRKQVYEDTVTSYTELMIEGVVFKGVDVFDDGKDIWLANGFHRYHAHKRAGYKTIECNVITGTKRDAWAGKTDAPGQLPPTEVGGQRTAVTVELGFDDEAARELVRVGAQVEHLGLHRDVLEQRVDAHLGARRHVDVDGLATPDFGVEAVRRELLADARVQSYPRISLETVIRLDPDVIIDASGMGDEPADFPENRKQV